MNYNPNTSIVDNSFNKTKHELALELAKMYIEKHKDKYNNDQQFTQMCSDFYTQYKIALKTIEAMERK